VSENQAKLIFFSPFFAFLDDSAFSERVKMSEFVSYNYIFLVEGRRHLLKLQ